MGFVWELDLPKPLKFLLLAMADHADHDGRNVYPGVELLAWKTGDHPRTVQRNLRELEALGLIEVEAAGGGVVRGGLRGRATVYRLTLWKGDNLPPFRPREVIPNQSTTPAPLRAEPRRHGARNPGASATPTVLEPSEEPSVAELVENSVENPTPEGTT